MPIDKLFDEKENLTIVDDNGDVIEEYSGEEIDDSGGFPGDDEMPEIPSLPVDEKAEKELIDEVGDEFKDVEIDGEPTPIDEDDKSTEKYVNREEYERILREVNEWKAERAKEKAEREIADKKVKLTTDKDTAQREFDTLIERKAMAQNIANDISNPKNADAKRYLQTVDADIYKAAAKLHSAEEKISEFETSQEEQKSGGQMPTATKDWIDANKHWLNDPKFMKARDMAIKLEAAYEQRGYNMDDPRIYNHITSELVRKGFKLPKSNEFVPISLTDDGKDYILENDRSGSKVQSQGQPVTRKGSSNEPSKAMRMTKEEADLGRALGADKEVLAEFDKLRKARKAKRG